MSRATTLFLRFCLLLLTFYITACEKVIDSSNFSFFEPGQLEKIQASGELRVLTRNAPTTYYQDKSGWAGMEYDLINSFADSINVTAKFITKDSTSEILNALTEQEADIAAAGLSQTISREAHFSYGPVYQKVEQLVVCRRGGKIPKTKDDLVDIKIWVTAATSYVDSLKKLKMTLPDLKWGETNEYDTEQLLEQVWEKKIPCTIADSNIVSINRRYYPELVVAFNLGSTESLSWLFHEKSEDMDKALKTWYAGHVNSGELAATIERYYGFVDLFNYVDLRKFKKSLKKRLPKFKDYFQKAAQKHGLSWTLLAAQSYQESHWKSRAKSPTGVRGMMMLTLVTARELGIKNRINAKNSIFGGAKYMKKLIKRLPDEIVEPDRTWFALAAYNVGMGHIYDARALAKQQNKDPNKWHDLITVLPLLSQKRYYSKLKYGYARGREPVRYVQRIRDFHDILEKELSDLNVKSAKVLCEDMKNAIC